MFYKIYSGPLKRSACGSVAIGPIYLSLPLPYTSTYTCQIWNLKQLSLHKI